MRGGPASHIDQGRHSRFTGRVLQRPACGPAVVDRSAPRKEEDKCACVGLIYIRGTQTARANTAEKRLRMRQPYL